MKPMDQTTEAAARHHAAKWRRRRIIMNNDGIDVRGYDPEMRLTPERFLEYRTSPLADSQVDTIFYCDYFFNVYTPRAEHRRLLLDEASGDDGKTHTFTPWARQLIEQDTDPLAVVSAWCRAHDREIFWSLRMNDLHDSGRGGKYKLCSPWKKTHPEYLMGARPDYSLAPRKLGRNMLDYERSEVREHIFSLVDEVVTDYDLDGIELDFCRHPFFFFPQMNEQPVGDDHRSMMSDLVRRIRDRTQAAARRRGKPFLLAARLPDDPGFCAALGLDLDRWLREQWLDLLIGGDYFKLRPWADWTALGKTFDLPVYPCLTSRRIMGGGQPLAATDLPRWRGEAFRAWQAGVDGMYTFNRFDPHHPLFRELGDPQILQALDRIDQESFATNDGSRLDPDYWLKNGRRFLRQPSDGNEVAP